MEHMSDYEEKKEKKEELPKNFQYPKYKKIDKKEYEVVLVGKGFLILKNEDGNNEKVSHSFSNLYVVKEKIYKENGIFLWKAE